MTSKIKVDNINKVSDDSNIINKCGTTITLGASGDSINLAAGASQTGFGRTGTVDWQTGSIKTVTFTSVNGEGYFVNTTAGVVTMNLPASPSAGDIVSVKDYLFTFATYNLTVGRNGSKIGGASAADLTVSTNGAALTFIYVDGTQGWLVINESNDTSTGLAPAYVTATVSGACNTLTTVCTNYKVATFLGPGTFCVSCAGNCKGSNTVDYLVVAGGAAGGSAGTHGGTLAGGGGAGGYRESPGAASGCYSVSPRGTSPAAALPVSVTAYSITVGSGGAAAATGLAGGSGGVSTFSSITSAGGGGGKDGCGVDGGSGGGAGAGGGSGGSGGTGNTPSVTPAQGTDGGDGVAPQKAAGGGGATEAGGPGSGTPIRGKGGDGGTSEINGSPVTRGGGGGGANTDGTNGGAGGGGPAPTSSSGGSGTAGTVNTGGGGGGGPHSGPACVNGGQGGSGIVIIRYKFQ